MQKLFTFLLALITVFAFSGCGGGNSGNSNNQPNQKTSPGVITISGANPRLINGTIYGQNYWSWIEGWGDTVNGALGLAQSLGIKVLRAGGGNNDRQDPESFDSRQVDEFISYCQAVGAEPILQVPILSGNANNAANIVAYCNITKGYNIKYWEIGNEPDLYHDMGDRVSYTVEDYINDFNTYVDAMKAVDPQIKIVGPDLGWKYWPPDNDWLTPFLNACKDKVDIISVHRYQGDAASCTIENAMKDADKFRANLNSLQNIMNICGVSNKPLAITETHVSWEAEQQKSNQPASPQTFYAGLWVADTIGVALEYNLWSLLFWSISEGNTTGFVDNITFNPRPSYYAMQMYTTHFGTSMLRVVSVPSGFSVYASRSAGNDRTILMVINKNNSNAHETIKFQDFSFASADLEYDFPAYSLTCLSIPDGGGAMEVWSYTKDLADQRQPPQKIQ